MGTNDSFRTPNEHRHVPAVRFWPFVNEHRPVTSHDDIAQVTLLDGSTVSVRRLSSEDVDAVINLHEQLTARERYLRFFVAHPAYLTTFAHQLVECTETQHALGAFEDGQLIGVASYVASDEPGVAEVAVAVAHADHLRGVATALLIRLREIARANAIHTFTADVLAENSAMLRVLSDAGWPRTSHRDGSVLSIRMDLGTPRTP